MERNCKQQCARVGSSPPLVGFHPTRGKVIVSPPTIHQQLANLVHQLSPPKMTRYLIVKYISMKLGVLNHLLSSKRWNWGLSSKSLLRDASLPKFGWMAYDPPSRPHFGKLCCAFFSKYYWSATKKKLDQKWATPFFRKFLKEKCSVRILKSATIFFKWPSSPPFWKFSETEASLREGVNKVFS